ncbi:MAG: hypothetical protein ABJA79_02140 [Parafilimonas sp.]
MVQTDILQLSKECNNWREALHSWRDEFNHFKTSLHKVNNKSLSKEQWAHIEHYQNLLHIQLINIHDLKQAVKAHDRKVNFEVDTNNGQIADDTLAHHEHLFDEFQSLENTLNDFRSDCQKFISSLQ